VCIRRVLSLCCTVALPSLGSPIREALARPGCRRWKFNNPQKCRNLRLLYYLPYGGSTSMARLTVSRAFPFSTERHGVPGPFRVMVPPGGPRDSTRATARPGGPAGATGISDLPGESESLSVSEDFEPEHRRG